jgi:hypothetical protein
MSLLLSLMIVVSSVSIFQKEAVRPKPTQTPVDVWCGGDDAYTQGVCDAVEKAFASSPDFDFNSETKPETLVVTIPTNVDWKQIGKRTRVFYKVEFTSAGEKKLRTSKGSCWNDDFAKCANQILKQARIALRKLHPEH